jgi:predicted dehydrogenase
MKPQRNTQSFSSTRRQFLKGAAAASAGALAFPSIIPSSALGADGATAPSERVVMGWIGTGGQGRALMNEFLGHKAVQIVALCNVDTRHFNPAFGVIDERRGNHNGVQTYKDFRELVARKDIDAVTVATPDHWHALASVAALDSGKDVYCEKPLANTVFEGRQMVDAVKRNNRVLQVGSMERSNPKVRFACELVRNGRIGKVHTIHVNLPDDDGHLAQAKATMGVPPAEPIPQGLDWDMWLGHTPVAPYSEKRAHFWWRFILAHGGGEMTDRGAHVIDLAGLAMGYDEEGIMPVEFEAKGRQNKGSLYDAWWDYNFTCTYPDGVKMVGSNKHPRGIKFEGDKGWIFINIHGGDTEASDPKILKEKIGENEIQLGRVRSHRHQFVDCVKTRKQGFAPVEVGHTTATICHLNNIAMAVGRKFKWDPKAERTDNDEANKMLKPNMRAPWTFGTVS